MQITYVTYVTYVTGRLWLSFPYRDREFDMETDVFA